MTDANLKLNDKQIVWLKSAGFLPGQFITNPGTEDFWNMVFTELHRLAWRPISEAPRDGTFVLCAHPSGHINIMQFSPEDNKWRRWVNNDYHDWKPTHWMPLPPAPKEDA